MSSLRAVDLETVGKLVDFIRGAGYVLDFSDRSFAQFFATELSVDIDDPSYSDFGSSKGKRLRRFLELADDPTAARTLQALWEHRAHYLEEWSKPDPVANAAGKYRALLDRLGGLAPPPSPPPPAMDHAQVQLLKAEVIELSTLPAQQRGYAFEKFLMRLFDLFGTKPREPFRNRGEQIDGSFVFGTETYLLEAKWQNEKTGAADLHSFEGKLSQKAWWARGLFISHSGFTDEGLDAFGKGKRTICMDGLDLYEMLERSITLDQVLERKVRRAAENGLPHVPVRHLF